MSSFEILASQDDKAFKDSEVFRFSSFVADARLALRPKDPDREEYPRFEADRYPCGVNLLACSSKYSYFVAGTLEGFVLGKTKKLREAFMQVPKSSTELFHDKVEVPIKQGPVYQLRITADERLFLVGVAGGLVLVYAAKDVLEKKADAQPVQAFNVGDDILDLRPNPEALPDTAAVLLKSGQCKVMNAKGETITTIPGDDVTAICWSPKGKQLVCGRQSGKLEHFDLKGVCKDSIDAPTEMRAGYDEEEENRYVLAVLWIETHVFLVMYARPRKSPDDEHVHDAYIVDRKSKKTGGMQYTHLEDVTPVFSSDSRNAYVYMETIRDFSKEIPLLVILAHSATTDVSVVGMDETGDWATWLLPETGLANMPLSEETSMDTYPMGIAIDYSVSELLPPYDVSISSEGVKPMPAFYYLNDEGHMGAYYCYNDALASRGEKYAGMIEAEDVEKAPVPSLDVVTKSEQTAQAEATAQSVKESTEYASRTGFGATSTATPVSSSAFSSSPFGAALQQQQGSSESFTNLLSGTTASTPVTGGFGTGGETKIPSFSSLKTSATARAPSFGTAPGMFGTASTAPKFGSTSFGTAPKFGTTSFGSTSFGTSTLGEKPAGAIEAQDVKKASAPTLDVSTKSEETAKAETTAQDVASTKPGETATAETVKESTEYASRTGFGTTSTTKPTVSTAFSSSPFGAALQQQQGSSESFANLLSNTTTSTPVTGGFGEGGDTKTPSFSSLKTSATAKAPSFGSAPGMFGTASTAPKFGSTSFGTPAFSTTSFGTPSFGSTSFGTVQKPVPPTTTAPTSVPSTKPESAPTTTPASGPASLLPAESKFFLAEPLSSVPASAPTVKDTTTEEKLPTLSSLKLSPETKPSPPPLSSTKLTTEAKPSPSPLSSAKLTTEAKQPLPPSLNVAKASTEAKPSDLGIGMAKAFESTYLSVIDALDQLRIRQEQIAGDIEAQSKQQFGSKSLQDLHEFDSTWKVADMKDFASVIDKITSDAEKFQTNVDEMRETIKYLGNDYRKLLDKSDQIKKIVEDEEENPELKKMVESQQLDPDTRSQWTRIASKSLACSKHLENLETTVHERLKKSKSPAASLDTNFPSLYSLHRALRDVENEITAKRTQLKELEEQLAYLRLKENHKRALDASSRITVDDYDEDEQGEEQQQQQQNVSQTDSAWPEPLVQYTVRYLRRERFIDQLCRFQQKKTPHKCKATT